MNIKLSQKQIGQRITELRKMKGLSQEDLAKSVKISRPSLAQIELGNRSVDILELQKLSLLPLKLKLWLQKLACNLLFLITFLICTHFSCINHYKA